MSTKDALVKAEEAGLDLVQISNADPIVCKIMDYGKFLFDEKKQKNLQKKKQNRSRSRKSNSVLVPMKAIIRSSYAT